MPTLIITVDPQCCRCITKLQNILCCIQDRGEFVIDKISYEKDKVHVSGPFDAQKLYCKLLCKAGKIIKGIEVAKPPKSDPPKCTCVCVCVCVCTPESKPDPAKCTCVCVCTPEPKPDPRKCTCVCVCVCVCTPEPKPDPRKCTCVCVCVCMCVCVCVCTPEPKPDPVKCMRVCVSGCPTPNCKCHSKPPPPPSAPPTPAPAPPKLPTCVCPMWPSCHCCSYPPTSIPYPALLVCEENPPYGACAVM